MHSHNRTPSLCSPLRKPYAQVAEQALFVAVLSGFLVMAGGFLSEVLSSRSDDCIAAAPALKPEVKPQPAPQVIIEPKCANSESC
jgi:hypothetical protein